MTRVKDYVKENAP